MSENEWPEEARTGPFAIGTPIMVSRDSIHEGFRNPDLPQWFPAIVCEPPPETGNGYRWYDPYIWYQTEADLSNGGEWPTANRGMCSTGKLSSFGAYRREYWAVPLADFRRHPSTEVIADDGRRAA